MRNGLGDRVRPREALYDLWLDPNERENLLDDPSYREVYEELTTRLEEWMIDTEDPLIDGPVPKPDGARITKRDCLHSGEDRYEDQNVR